MKRIAVPALLALLLLAAAGCAALFDTDVYSEVPYEAPSDTSETEDAADTISNYAALRRAIARLVSERAESAVLQFQNYDGVISRDISTACWEVKSSTAMGAFAVDYISYDLSRIVSYTQAEIHISYKRSEYQMSALEKLSNLPALRTRLEEALGEGETYLVLEITAASLTADTVRQSVERAYYSDPMICPVLPAADVSLYPDTGVTRIAEVTLDYGLDGASLEARREELQAALDELLAEAFPAADAAEAEEDAAAAPDEAEMLRSLCETLSESCVWDESAGMTAWNALYEHTASSEGMAMALGAACRALDIDCRIVFGRLDGESHVWNMVTIGESSYHVDVSRWNEDGEPVFLAGDEELWGAYWWDTSEYPASPARYGASGEATEEMTSTEPEETGEDGKSIEN